MQSMDQSFSETEARNGAVQILGNSGNIHYTAASLSRDEMLYHSFQNASVFLVPFERDRGFVQRGDCLPQIVHRFKSQHRLAIAGIGGIGKSQIAIEYCYVFRDTYPQCNVLWIHAGTAARLTQAYMDLAQSFRLPGWDDPQIDSLQLVTDTINRDRRKWLIVLDNVDDREVVFSSPPLSSRSGPHPKPLMAYIPSGSHISVLITTRDVRIGRDLAGGNEPVLLSPLSDQEALLMLVAKIPNSSESDIEMRELAVCMDFLPLAISQAAAFIRNNSLSVSKYLDLYYTDKSAEQLFHLEHYDPRRYGDAPSSVIKTLNITFQQVIAQHPRAAKMLSRMGVLDRQGLPEILLRDDNESSVEFYAAIGTLRALSLIKEEKGGTTYEIHRLVQLAIRRGFKDNMEERQAEVLQRLADVFPKVPEDDVALCEQLLPHAHLALDFAGREQASQLSKANLLRRLGLYDKFQGHYGDAIAKLQEETLITEQCLGTGHELTVVALSKLVQVHVRPEDCVEIEALARRVLETCERDQVKSTTLLLAMNSLAYALESRGKRPEAEQLSWRALELSEKHFGLYDNDTVISVRFLANVLTDQWKFAEAESLLSRKLQELDRVLGSEHVDTLSIAQNLAYALEDLGKFAEAEALSRRVLEAREKALGSYNTLTVSSMTNLAWVLVDQGHFGEADNLLKRVVHVNEKQWGYDHPTTLNSVSEIAWLYYEQGNYELAEEVARHSIKRTEKRLDQYHPLMLKSSSTLSSILAKQEKYSEAEALDRAVLRNARERLGEDHSTSLIYACNLAWVLERQKRYTEAEKLLVSTLDKMREFMSPDHPEAYAGLLILGRVLLQQGRLHESEQLILRVYAAKDTTLRKSVRRITECMTDLARLYRAQGRGQEAEKLLRDAVALSASKFGEMHPDTKYRRDLLLEWNSIS